MNSNSDGKVLTQFKHTDSSKLMASDSTKEPLVEKSDWDAERSTNLKTPDYTMGSNIETDSGQEFSVNFPSIDGIKDTNMCLYSKVENP